jgi:hypothetical protein
VRTRSLIHLVRSTKKSYSLLAIPVQIPLAAEHAIALKPCAQEGFATQSGKVHRGPVCARHRE